MYMNYDDNLQQSLSHYYSLIHNYYNFFSMIELTIRNIKI